MRIAILTHGISPFGHEYARAFAELGHEAEVFSLSACDPSAEGTPTRLVGPPDYRPWERESRLPYLKTILPLRRAVRDTRPDILFALYLTSAGVLACLSGHPHVVPSAQGSDVLDHVDSRLWRRVFRWQARRGCLFHAVSEHLARLLRERVGVPAEKMLVRPVGVDTRRFALVDPSARPGTGQILCTRSHKPVYDQATFVRALARLKERGIRFHVTFAHAFLADTTRPLVREAGLEDDVTFLGGYRLAELPALLAKADVYASTSLSDGTSVSLLEAMATGLFPVVTDIPANRPWVEQGRTGYLFPAGDDAALADRLAEALAGADLRARAAPQSRALVVEKGDLLDGARKLVEAFRACLER